MNLRSFAKASGLSVLCLAWLGAGDDAAGRTPTAVHQHAGRAIEIRFLAGVHERRLFDAHCYAIVDTKAKLAAIIDPGARTGPEMHQYLRSRCISPAYVLITHAHGDHIGGLDYYLRNTAARVVTNRVEIQQFPSKYQPRNTSGANSGVDEKRYLFVSDEQTIRCGSVQVKILLTPGHTLGSECYYLVDEHLLFAGDTIFRGSIGRTDLSHNAGRECLVAYARAKLLTLPPHTRILPGHGEFTSVAREKATNPFFAASPAAAGQPQAASESRPAAAKRGIQCAN